MEFTPICLFVYNRINETKQTIHALQKNYLAPESDLFIFSDGPKNKIDAIKVYEVREFLKGVHGFKSVKIFESPHNKGLANSVIDGATKIITKYNKIIALEDDLVTSPNFLNFMNQAIDFYASNSSIFSISGYTLELPSLKFHSKDYYLGKRASSLGWATWKNRWEIIDWEVKNYNKFKYNIVQQLQFMRIGSDLPRMLKSQMKGQKDSWAIRWCFHQFQECLLTVFPTKSKLVHIGYGNEATNAKKTNRFHTTLDNGIQTSFEFDTNLVLEPKILKEFRNKFSIVTRLKDKFNK